MCPTNEGPSTQLDAQRNSSFSLNLSSVAYAALLIERLAANAPRALSVIGSSEPLYGPMTAFLCSKEAPGATILKAFDQAATWREAGTCVISGFHSLLERQCLDILLRGKQSVVMCPARSIEALRLKSNQRKALEDGRLTIISPFAASERRATADLAYQRNRFIAALANEVVFAFITPDGSLARLRHEIRGWGTEVRVLQS
jgi:predicted Rossmann fold nucleotide-binding protein DprA/Smf involved in DNA uptake